MIKYKPLKSLVMGVAIVLAVLWITACGGSSSSPPVSLPAPVSGLISVTVPDHDGFSHVSGAAASVEGSATVTVTNATTSGTVSTTAETDGSFETEIAASLGDQIQVTQTSAGEESEETSYDVSDGSSTSTFAPIRAVVYSTGALGAVAGTDGTDTFIDSYDLATGVLEGSVTISNFNVNDFDMVDLDIASSSGDAYLIDTDQSQAAIVNGDGSLQGGSAISITSPVAISVHGTNNYAVIGQADPDVSISVLDNETGTPEISTTLAITHPTDSTATHNRSFAVSLSDDASGNPLVAVLSLFGGGETIFSLISLSGTTPQIVSQNNLGSPVYSSVKLYNSSTEALISIEGSDEVLHLSGTSFATEQTVSVGSAPWRIAIDANETKAYVINSGDNTISNISLSDLTVSSTLTTSDGIGLGPVALDVDSTLGIIFVANTEDSSVSFITESQ